MRSRNKAVGALFIVLTAAVVVPRYLAGWDPASVHDKAARDAFAGAHMTKTAPPPFSFVYGGRPLSTLIPKWTVTSEERTEGAKLVRTIVYADPATGLRIPATYTIYQDFPAAEWVLRLKNTGKADTPIIDTLRACAVSFPGFAAPASGPVTLYRARGSNAARSDFGPIEDPLAPKAEVKFGPTAGRSSDTNALPFFNITSSGHGIVAALGWSGRWQAVV